MNYINKCQNLNKMTKILLDGCSSTLENFLVKHIYILFWSVDTISSILTKNALKKILMEKKFNFFKSCPKYDFWTKNNYNCFSTNDLFAQIAFPCLL